MTESEWEEIEIEDLKYMIEGGFSLAEVVEVLGKSKIDISNKIERMGLVSPRINRERDGKLFCLNCKTFKEKNEFSKYRSSEFGYRIYCKECHNFSERRCYHSKKLREIQKIEQKIVKTKEQVNNGKLRRCSTCKNYKSVEEYFWRRKYETIHDQCKVCADISTRKSKLKRLGEKGY